MSEIRLQQQQSSNSDPWVVVVVDSHNDHIKVATITDESERIVRVVAKGNYSLAIETLYCPHDHYEWQAQHVYLGQEELLSIAEAVRRLPVEDE